MNSASVPRPKVTSKNNIQVQDYANEDDKILNKCVRLNPPPRFGHKALYYELLNDKNFGEEFVNRCANNWKRSEGVLDDFVSTLEKAAEDEPINYSSWNEEDQKLFLVALSHVGMKVMAPKYKSKIIHFADLFHLNWNWKASAGYPFVLQKDTMSKRSAWNTFTHAARSTVHNIKYMSYNACVNGPLILGNYLIMGYNRFHISKVGEFAKIRLVFGVPMILISCEMMLLAGYMFMIKYFQNTSAAYGKETLRGGMAYINSKVKHGDAIIVDDISGFDYHVYFWLLKIMLLFAFNNYISFDRYWPTFKLNGIYFSTPMDPVKMKAKFKNVLVITFRWMTELKTYLPTHQLLTRSFQLLPSGLFLTTWVDTFYNALMTVHTMLAINFEIEDLTFLINLGDDIVFTIDRQALIRKGISANEFYRRFNAKRKQLYNMSSKPGSAYVGTDKNKIVFLRYRNENGRPIRDLEELIAGALNRERHSRPEHQASILIGLAWAAAGTSLPLHNVLRRAYDFCIKVSSDKGVNQEVDLTDRFITVLQEDYGFSDDKLKVFPSYEEVLDRATRYQPDTEPHSLRALPSDVFAYPRGSYISLFEPFDSMAVPTIELDF